MSTMTTKNFSEKLEKAYKDNQSMVCVGLDTDLDKIPDHLKSSDNPIFEFNKQIIDVTADLVCAYKPNAAFYEAQGQLGLEALEKTIEYIPDDIPVILDAKRGDIGNTCEQYAKACFEHLKADAVTISPYMGFDSVSPFAKYEGKALFILVKTSNQSAPDIQDIINAEGEKVNITVSKLIANWQKESAATLGAVVGATYPDDLQEIRTILKDCPILLPGIGAQSGDAQKTVQYGRGSDFKAPILINSSRGILYASNEKDFASSSKAKTLELRDKLNSYL